MFILCHSNMIYKHFLGAIFKIYSTKYNSRIKAPIMLLEQGKWQMTGGLIGLCDKMRLGGVYFIIFYVLTRVPSVIGFVVESITKASLSIPTSLATKSIV